MENAVRVRSESQHLDTFDPEKRDTGRIRLSVDSGCGEVSTQVCTDLGKDLCH